MRVLLIYDITSDRVRSKVADACLDYGLDRIQFSAFMGELSRNHQEELILRIKGLVELAGGKVWLLPVGDKEWQKRLTLEYEDA